MTRPAPANASFSAPIVLAAKNLGAASGFRTSEVHPGRMAFWLVVAAGVIAAVCLGLYLFSRLVHQWRHHSHRSLFSGLCRIHTLDREARALLSQVARQHRLPHPARLFTEPKWLDPAGLPDPLRGRSAEVAALRNRLFG